MPYKDPEKNRQSKHNWYIQNRDRISSEQHEYYVTHRHLRSATRNAENRRRHSFKWKSAFLDLYGRQCACCGETIFEFLTIEHVDGRSGPDGHMLGAQSYKYAVEHYDPTKYQVLCMNCNFARGRFGYCPHQKIQQGIREGSMVGNP